MNQEQAIEIAKTGVEMSGWGWRDPVEATKYRLFVIIGPVRWRIRTSVGLRGGNAVIVIDDKTGRIIRKGFIPR